MSWPRRAHSHFCLSYSWPRLRAVDAGTDEGIIVLYVQWLGDGPELWGQVRYMLFLSGSPDDEDDGGW